MGKQIGTPDLVRRACRLTASQVEAEFGAQPFEESFDVVGGLGDGVGDVVERAPGQFVERLTAGLVAGVEFKPVAAVVVSGQLVPPAEPRRLVQD